MTRYLKFNILATNIIILYIILSYHFVFQILTQSNKRKTLLLLIIVIGLLLAGGDIEFIFLGGLNEKFEIFLIIFIFSMGGLFNLNHFMLFPAMGFLKLLFLLVLLLSIRIVILIVSSFLLMVFNIQLFYHLLFFFFSLLMNDLLLLLVTGGTEDEVIINRRITITGTIMGIIMNISLFFFLIRRT